MKVLITGGGGFLGAWLIRRLVPRGIGVRVLDLAEDRRLVCEIAGEQAGAVEWQLGSVAQYEDVERALDGCDAVIHLAGVLTPACQRDPIRGAQVNLIGTLNVFEAARKAGIRTVLYASSAGVYGPEDSKVPHPVTHYGAFKLAAEGCARAYWHDHGIASVGLRPFIVYGPGREIGSSAGPSVACRAALAGEPYVIPFGGETGLVYVEDVAAVYEQALLTPISGAHVFNLAGEKASVEQVITHIQLLVPGAQLRAEGNPLPIASDIASDDLTALLPNFVETPLAQGLQQTIEFYRAARGAVPA